MEVNAELYDFLKEHETGMLQNEQGVIGFVHVPFYKLDDFVKVVGASWFDEGGIEVHLFNDTVCIEINDIVEGEGHSLLNYLRCFDDYEIRRYKRNVNRN
jgi:hypothetical protein